MPALKLFLLIDFRERGRERNINLLLHLWSIHYLSLVCALSGDQTCNLGVLGLRSIQLSYLARAYLHLFLILPLFHYVGTHINQWYFYFSPQTLLIYSFWDRGAGEEVGEGEKHQCVWEKHQSVACCMPPTGDTSHNPGLRSTWELNQQPFVLQAGARSTEPHQPGLSQWYFLNEPPFFCSP